MAPGGDLVTVELTAVPYLEGSGRVMKTSPSGETSVVARATTTATGVAVAGDGTIFVVEHSRSLGQPPFIAPGTGRLVRLTADGRLESVAEGLMWPTVARIGPDGSVYVAHVSVDGDHGEGQILRIAASPGM
jgi:hypothetical protein